MLLPIGPRRGVVMVAVLALAPVWAPVPDVPPPPGWMLVDLNTVLGGSSSVAYDINDKGDVVGESRATDGARRAFIWSAAHGLTDLGALGAEVAYHVNNSGQVIGLASSGGHEFPFLWSEAAGLSNLESSLGPVSIGDLNDAGQLVGAVSLDATIKHAFVWSPGAGMVDLGTLGGPTSYARTISATGQVVGWSTIATGEMHAFSWTEADGMMDLGTLGGTDSHAYGVNVMGQVVGDILRTDDGSYNHSFWWSKPSGMYHLYASVATDINDASHIVGYGLPSTNAVRGFFKPAGAPYVDLGTRGGFDWPHFPPPSSQALALNNAGQIVGWSGLFSIATLTPCCGAGRGRTWSSTLARAQVSGRGGRSSGSSSTRSVHKRWYVVIWTETDLTIS